MAFNKLDRKQYKYYVFNSKTKKIITGWEYRNDALDFLHDSDNSSLKVYTRTYLKNQRIDPSKNTSWGSDLGMAIYKPIPEVVLSGDFHKKKNISEIKVRFNKGKPFGNIRSSDDVYQFLLKVYGRQISLQEHFVLLLADNNLNIIGYYNHTVGTPVSTLADIPMLMGIVLKTMARSFIVSHNHPSGNKNPSEADKALTNNLIQAAKSLNLKLLDHVIVTKDNGYYSFADEGMLFGISELGKTNDKKENLEQALRKEVLLQLKKVNDKPQLTPNIHKIIQSEKGYRWIENRIIQMMIADGITVSASIPQIEAEL